MRESRLFRARFAYFRAVHLLTKRAVEIYRLILDEQKGPPRRDNARVDGKPCVRTNKCKCVHDDSPIPMRQLCSK
jgi:hypothetical protein